MTLAELNRAEPAAFVAALGHVFEHSPWVAHQVVQARPFARVDDLHAAMVRAVEDASPATQLALIRAHPELAGKAAVQGDLTPSSSAEQAGAGLNRCTPAELARLHTLNARYRARFGFPFILAVKGYDRAGVLRELERRLARSPDEERAESLAQIARIAKFRLESLLHD